MADRLCHAGEGRQILCSSVVAALLSGRQAFSFRDHGELELKGIPEPLVHLLRPAGLLVADNLLSHAEELAGFREAAQSHPELECLLVPIPREELLCRKRSA